MLSSLISRPRLAQLLPTRLRPARLLPTRLLTVLVVACFVFCSGMPAAQALTSITLKNLVAEECPADAAYAAGLTTSGSSMKATCYLVKGTAVNKSAKDIVDADVFGRIYDADGNSVMANRYRIGGIEYVPRGESKFSFRLSVPANQPGPLALRQFKASGFASKVRRFQSWDRSIDE